MAPPHPLQMKFIQPLQFPPLSNIPNLDTLDNDESSIPFDTMTKMELCAMIMSLIMEMKQVKKHSRKLIQDCTTLISQWSLVHAENKKLQSDLFKREKK